MTNRAIDAEVAEKVMGYSGRITVYAHYDRTAKARPVIGFAHWPKDARPDYGVWWNEAGVKLDRGSVFVSIPLFTTDPAAAWTAVGKMRSDGYRLEIMEWSGSAKIPPGLLVAFRKDRYTWAEIDPDICRAIVGACLRAKGVHNPLETISALKEPA